MNMEEQNRIAEKIQETVKHLNTLLQNAVSIGLDVGVFDNTVSEPNKLTSHNVVVSVFLPLPIMKKG
jgi:hypothetical protein